jgi:secretion/DNA translocation related TadE-like protein
MVVTLTGLLVVLTLLAGVLGRLVVDQRRASSAADLAALAGAAEAQVGGDPCRAAGVTASRNAADLVGCRVSGDEVTVVARVVSPGLGGMLRRVGGPFDVEAEARAGPVGTATSGG